MVSIIVPVYNVEKYLERCVDSIINQTYKELEIILVDDGATDSSPELCEQFAKKDARIQVIHKKNGGLSDARNAGIPYASGEFLYFCDSDDYIEKNLIKDCVAKITEENADLLIFDFYRVQNGTTSICTEKIPEKTFTLDEIPEVLLTSPSACNKFFRTEFLKNSEILFPFGRLYEDLGTLPKLYQKAKKISYLKKPYYYYDIREGSIMTASRFDKGFEDRIGMINEILTYYKSLQLGKKYEKELEYFAFYNGVFLPIRESALRGCTKEQCNRYKKEIMQAYPKCFKNEYIHSMTRKEKLFVSIIKSGQYWMLPVISKLKTSIKGVK